MSKLVTTIKDATTQTEGGLLQDLVYIIRDYCIQENNIHTYKTRLSRVNKEYHSLFKTSPHSIIVGGQLMAPDSNLVRWRVYYLHDCNIPKCIYNLRCYERMPYEISDRYYKDVSDERAKFKSRHPGYYRTVN